MHAISPLAPADMSLPPPAPPASGDVLVLADTRTGVERDLVARWVAEQRPVAEVIHRGDRRLPARLAEERDVLIVPVRVTWLPREVDGDRRMRVGDLLALTNPRRPAAYQQRRIAAREPDRVRVTDGEPALASALRLRFRTETAGGDASAFAQFVARQATLACERAERAIIGDRYKVPRLVAEQITASARFQEHVHELAEELDRPFDEVLAYAEQCLQEVAAVQSPLAIDLFNVLMGPMHRRAWTVHVDHESLERLHDLGRRHALIFLPSHRSYVDPLVLADVLSQHDFPRNHLLGGDNLNFWPLGGLGKRSGVIFIRRSFGDDEVYKLAVREYLGHLVSKRFNIEWYIEGGRTRTGKLRPPRFGLLRYIVRAIEEQRADDVMLVPVSIVYDHLHEVGAMAAEQTGAAKQGEGLRWLADYVRAQRENAGNARVSFGEAFSLRTALDEAGEGSAQLEKVAFRICEGINRATPVTAPSLLTFALLGVRDRALTLDQVARVTAPLLEHVRRRGLPGDVSVLEQPEGLRAGLDELVRAGVASAFTGGPEPVWYIDQDHHAVAAFSRNGALHHVMNRAIVELVLVRLASEPIEGDLLEAASENALALRDLLKFEFFFAAKRRFLHELERELELLAPDWRGRVQGRGDVAALLSGSRTLVAHRALRSFLDAQLVVARCLVAHDPREAIDRSAFVAECLGTGRQMLLQGELHGAESVSSELFSGALALAANRDLIDPGRDEVRVAREAFLAEVQEVLGRLVRIGELDAALLEEVLVAGG
ncbi:MAG TPA: glycerol-3-phosphate 1-O-acyltransferase [Solirubrobacteraceae bacterium]|jgi:glycerol-3-phosphate O-acyltransferase|nr:glycerol-3-phosphate 1-O-acyltransferase [Solirubrobacteraceae bacterium]